MTFLSHFKYANTVSRQFKYNDTEGALVTLVEVSWTVSVFIHIDTQANQKHAKFHTMGFKGLHFHMSLEQQKPRKNLLLTILTLTHYVKHSPSPLVQMMQIMCAHSVRTTD